jgi:hypothetical protein
MAEALQNPKLRKLVQAMDSRLATIIASNPQLEDGDYIINEDGELVKKHYGEALDLRDKKETAMLSVNSVKNGRIFCYKNGDFRITTHQEQGGALYQTFTFNDISLPFSDKKLAGQEELVFHINITLKYQPDALGSAAALAHLLQEDIVMFDLDGNRMTLNVASINFKIFDGFTKLLAVNSTITESMLQGEGK